MIARFRKSLAGGKNDRTLSNDSRHGTWDVGPGHVHENHYPRFIPEGTFLVFRNHPGGKTRILENMVEQDIRKGYSVVVIDPKGDIDLFSKIVQVAFEEAGTVSSSSSRPSTRT
jgi:hypothetical protein